MSGTMIQTGSGTEAALIVLSRAPEVAEHLQTLKARWEAKATEAEAMPCSEETVVAVKAMRAELRKEFDAADEQRKAVKAQYMAPWATVEAAFRDSISGPFAAADAAYREKIAAVETELKDRLRARLQLWFSELCAARGLDFLTLDRALALAGVKISLADAKTQGARRLKDAITAAVIRVENERDNILQMEDAAEIMAEYKQSLDVGHAVACVTGWKRMVEAEREAAEQRRGEQARRGNNAPAVPTPVPEMATAAPERVYESFSFTVYGCTRAQLLKIREFLKGEGIRYE